MINLKSTRLLAALAVGALVLAGCGKDDEPKVELGKGAELLRYIPADTPYAFVALQPMPDKVLDKLEPRIDEILVSYRTVLRESVDAKVADESDSGMSAEDARRLQAFVDELSTILSVDGMRSAGIERDSTGAFYGNGLLPVVRIELSDPALFEATIERLEERAESELSVGETEGQLYRYLDADDLRIVIAIIESHAVFALMPTEFDDAQTARLLGLTMPAASLAGAGKIESIMSKYALQAQAVGFVDLPSVAERFVGEPSGLDADLFGLFEQPREELSDVCKAEIRAVANIMPRLVAGYTKIEPDRFESKLVAELRPDIAAGMQKLVAPVPGLGIDSDAMMSFGMSLDVMAARKFMESRLDAMEADPYECEHLADMQNGVAGARQSLNQPVPPMVYDFKGFLAVIDDVEGLDIETQTPPSSIDGTFLLAMDNAQNLINLGALFSPELAELNLQPNGKPVALDMAQFQQLGKDAFAALTESGLAISVGEDAESQAPASLGAKLADPLPFLSFNMDAARYYRFMGEAIALGDSDDEDAPTPEMKEAMNDMMQSIAEVYDRMSGDVLFTEHGVEINMTESLKD